MVAGRSSGGQLQYAPEVVDRVRFNQLPHAAGLGSKALLRVLPCMEDSVLITDLNERLLAERDRVRV